MKSTAEKYKELWGKYYELCLCSAEQNNTIQKQKIEIYELEREIVLLKHLNETWSASASMLEGSRTTKGE